MRGKIKGPDAANVEARNEAAGKIKAVPINTKSLFRVNLEC